jgi:cell division transport system permease protein
MNIRQISLPSSNLGTVIKMSFANALFSQTSRNLEKTWPTQLFTLLSVSLSVLIFAFFFLLYLNLTQVGNSLGGELRLTLYFEKEPVAEMQEQLRSRITEYAEVERIVYISPEEAFARLSLQLGSEKDVLAGLDSSFLPASFEIYPKRNLQSLARIRSFADYLTTLPTVQKVQYGQDWLQRFSSFIQLISIIVLISGSLLILTTIFMISHTIRLTLVARGDELAILRLLGADRTYIQGPLLLEGFLQGLLGSVMGTFLLYLLYEWTSARFSGSDLLGVYEMTFFPPAVVTVIILAGTLLCLTGCILSTRKFLRI